MSAQLLIDALEKLLKHHKSLYVIAVQKTDVIKAGDIDSLKKMMKAEQKHIAIIQKIEKEREQEVYKMVSGHEMDGMIPTISDCIKVANERDKQQLQQLQEQLLAEIFQIKQINYLNQQMIHQSLQFINFSLDMLDPQPQVINYQRPNQQQKSDKPMTRFSAYDSRA